MGHCMIGKWSLLFLLQVGLQMQCTLVWHGRCPACWPIIWPEPQSAVGTRQLVTMLYRMCSVCSMTFPGKILCHACMWSVILHRACKSLCISICVCIYSPFSFSVPGATLVKLFWASQLVFLSSCLCCLTRDLLQSWCSSSYSYVELLCLSWVWRTVVTWPCPRGATLLTR